MTFDSGTLGLPHTGVPLLRDLVHERTGIFYDDERCDLMCERLAGLVMERGFRSYLDLYYLLKYNAMATDWAGVMDALSVQETYFWREPDQIAAVVSHVIPQLLAASRGAAIRIWSVPCASGEEPLTIAMMLEEAGWFDRAPIEIYGSDASTAAIEKARAAKYRGRAFRAMPPALFEKYFVAVNGSYAPVPALRRRISSYSVVNLVDDDQTVLLARSPVVFCRNAFIYFSPAAVKRVVDMFADRMPRPAYLCVGASESLLNVTTKFALKEIDGAFVYVRE